MIKLSTLSDLDDNLIVQYRNAIQDAFPDIILSSKVIENFWDRVESYFPEYQIFSHNIFEVREANKNNDQRFR